MKCEKRVKDDKQERREGRGAEVTGDKHGKMWVQTAGRRAGMFEKGRKRRGKQKEVVQVGEVNIRKAD